MALNQTLKEKFNWEIPGLSVELKGYSHQDSDSEANDSEEEEGEYAPAIVEF
jgi:hypothetical protein